MMSEHNILHEILTSAKLSGLEIEKPIHHYINILNSSKHHFISSIKQSILKNKKVSTKQLISIDEIHKTELVANINQSCYPKYKKDQHIIEIVKVTKIDQEHVRINAWSHSTTHKITMFNDDARKFIVKTNSKKLLAVFILSYVTKDKIRMAGNVKWIPNGKTVPVLMNPRKLKVSFCEDD